MEANGSKRRQITLPPEESRGIAELSERLGVSQRVAFRKIVDAGFKYWLPERFGKLEEQSPLEEASDEGFYDLFSKGFEKSETARDVKKVLAEIEGGQYEEQKYLYALCFLVLVLICSGRSADVKDFAFTSPTSEIMDYALAFAVNYAREDGDVEKTESGMKSQGYKGPLFDTFDYDKDRITNMIEEIHDAISY